MNAPGSGPTARPPGNIGKPSPHSPIESVVVVAAPLVDVVVDVVGAVSVVVDQVVVHVGGGGVLGGGGHRGRRSDGHAAQLRVRGGRHRVCGGRRGGRRRPAGAASLASAFDACLRTETNSYIPKVHNRLLIATFREKSVFYFTCARY